MYVYMHICVFIMGMVLDSFVILSLSLLITRISTNPFLGPVRGKPSTLRLENSQNTIFLRPDLKNQTLLKCLESKSTDQPD